MSYCHIFPTTLISNETTICAEFPIIQSRLGENCVEIRSEANCEKLHVLSNGCHCDRKSREPISDDKSGQKKLKHSKDSLFKSS